MLETQVQILQQITLIKICLWPQTVPGLYITMDQNNLYHIQKIRVVAECCHSSLLYPFLFCLLYLGDNLLQNIGSVSIYQTFLTR